MPCCAPATGLRFPSAGRDGQADAFPIAGLASQGEGRVVTVGSLVLFSTSKGDAWILDVEDSLALCLMREFQRREVGIRNDPETFRIRWEASFTIEQGCFMVAFEPGRVTAYPSSPVSDIQQAIRRARRAAGR